MKNWQKSLITILITLVIGGIYLFFVWRHRQNPGVVPQNDTGQILSKDQLVVMREFFPMHFEDTLRLEGTTVWMKNGYTMPYYPYAGGQVLFGKRVGVIPAAEQMQVKKIVKAAVPSGVDDRIEHGSRQAFAVFLLPGSTTLFATPIGYMQGNEEAYYTDLLFFYDDPHTIYDHWPKDVWAAIDAHQVLPGMSEAETYMAIGRNFHTDGGTEGDRTLVFDQAGKHWTVTFVKNRATAIKTE
ncbi:MAG: hypothetical protein ABSE51_01495 [Terracidiphilus sp.]